MCIRDRLETLTLSAIDPKTTGRHLIGRLSGLWSARVGNYRVLYTIEAGGVIVRAIRHRGVAYGSRAE